MIGKVFELCLKDFLEILETGSNQYLIGFDCKCYHLFFFLYTIL